MNTGIDQGNEQVKHAEIVLDFSKSQLETRSSLMRDPQFFLILRQSVIDGMKKVLGGENAVTLLYPLMASIERPAEFHRRLRSVFGAASYPFEKSILEELYQKVNLPFRMQKGYQFADHVEIAARSLVKDRFSHHVSARTVTTDDGNEKQW